MSSSPTTVHPNLHEHAQRAEEAIRAAIGEAGFALTEASDVPRAAGRVVLASGKVGFEAFKTALHAVLTGPAFLVDTAHGGSTDQYFQDHTDRVENQVILTLFEAHVAKAEAEEAAKAIASFARTSGRAGLEVLKTALHAVGEVPEMIHDDVSHPATVVVGSLASRIARFVGNMRDARQEHAAHYSAALTQHICQNQQLHGVVNNPETADEHAHSLIAEAWGTIAGGVQAFFGNVGDHVADKAKDAVDAVKDAAEHVGDALREGWDKDQAVAAAANTTGSHPAATCTMGYTPASVSGSSTAAVAEVPEARRSCR